MNYNGSYDKWCTRHCYCAGGDADGLHKAQGANQLRFVKISFCN